LQTICAELPQPRARHDGGLGAHGHTRRHRHAVWRCEARRRARPRLDLNTTLRPHGACGGAIRGRLRSRGPLRGRGSQRQHRRQAVNRWRAPHDERPRRNAAPASRARAQRWKLVTTRRPCGKEADEEPGLPWAPGPLRPAPKGQCSSTRRSRADGDDAAASARLCRARPRPPSLDASCGRAERLLQRRRSRPTWGHVSMPTPAPR
jgi:hypothetical protein